MRAISFHITKEGAYMAVYLSVRLCVYDSIMTYQTIKTEPVNFGIIFRMLIKINNYVLVDITLSYFAHDIYQAVP